MEQIMLSSDTNPGRVQNDINGWLKKMAGKIKIIDRKFAMATQTPADYPHEREIIFCYCVVYRTIETEPEEEDYLSGVDLSDNPFEDVPVIRNTSDILALEEDHEDSLLD